MDIIYIGIDEWYSMRQRAQQLARGLAARHRLLYVNPLRSLPYHLRTRGLRQGYSPGTNSSDGQPNPWIFQPPRLFPWGSFNDTVNRINYRTLGVLMLRQLKRIGFENPVLWLGHPFALELANYVPYSLCCYDCMDNYPLFYDVNSPVRVRMEETERVFFHRADVIFATSGFLFDKARAAGGNVYLVPNASDFAHFNARPAAPLDCNFPYPVIGYMGTIGPWLDQELVEWIARRQSGWHWVFLGPVETNVNVLDRLPNVHLLGPRPYRDVPAYLQRFDVCSIPFKLNALTQAVDPVKLYEYFAAGKAVVATPLPEVQRRQPMCQTGATPADFMEKIELTLRESAEDPGAFARATDQRVQFARENTWTDRAAQVEAIISLQLAGKITT